MFSWPGNRNIVSILNTTALLYLSGVAAAIGFRMNLFNIGVEGQYKIAAFAAAAFAGQAWLPGGLNTAAAVVVAMTVGALWAGIAGVLRVWRGVSEVISTIMLNAIAGSLVTYFLLKVGVSNGNATNTKAIPEGSRVGTIRLFGDSPTELYGLSLLAIVVGVAFWVLLNRTRFGFDLRASGSSESAAVASGVDVKKMIVVTMLLSGAVAGLVGLPTMFSRLLRLRVRVPDRSRLHRHRRGAAGPQQPGRDRLRRADLRVPHRAGHPAEHPGRHLARHRLRDPGGHRARGRDRLRDRPPLPGPDRAGRGRHAAGRPAETASARGGGRHERPSRPTKAYLAQIASPTRVRPEDRRRAAPGSVVRRCSSLPGSCCCAWSG